jgi:hypothetical protein
LLLGAILFAVYITYESSGFNFAVYNYFGDPAGIILVGCLAHGRRKFIDAISNRKDIATQVLTGIQKIYAMERHLSDNGIIGDEKLPYRKENAIPLLKELVIPTFVITNGGSAGEIAPHNFWLPKIKTLLNRRLHD